MHSLMFMFAPFSGITFMISLCLSFLSSTHRVTQMHTSPLFLQLVECYLHCWYLVSHNCLDRATPVSLPKTHTHTLLPLFYPCCLVTSKLTKQSSVASAQVCTCWCGCLLCVCAQCMCVFLVFGARRHAHFLLSLF